ncbi:MAG: putative signal transducing protein [Thermodesulfobacteriota bacterium]
MFCPKCRTEYTEDLAMCPMCKVSLVNESSGQANPEFLKFVTVHETGDPAFIAFAKSILQSEGIKYYIKGEGLQDLFAGGRLGTGFNPVIGAAKIQVDENDVEKAKELLKQIEKGEFELLEGGADHDHAEKIEGGSARKHTLRYLLTGFMIGVLVSALGFMVYDYREKHLSGVVKYDLNKDSKPDCFYYYENGAIVKVEQDRNFDGKIDLWYFYKDGDLHHGVSDNNFDGIVDTWFNFKNGVLTQIEIDTNSDNKAEIIESYTNGVLSAKVWIHERSRRIWKKALYDGGVMREEYIDQDYDGASDIKITYDSSERPIKTYPLH